MIWFTSDLHFRHDRAFIYNTRGYSSIEIMNKEQIWRWNEVINENDIIYVLGDFILGTTQQNGLIEIVSILSSLKGKIKLIIGNHDTPAKIEIYKKHNIDYVYADMITYNKHQYYLSHYPTLTSTLESDHNKSIRNLFGHTHSTNKFYNDYPFMYNVAVDAHNGYPVSIEQIEKDIEKEILTCFNLISD